MVFVSDVTIKDGQTLYGNESFTKVWRVKNTGSCTWTPDYPEEADYPDEPDYHEEPDYGELCDPDDPDYWECRVNYNK